MSPELQAMLDAEAARQQEGAAELAARRARHGMIYRTRKAGLRATSTFYRPRQL